MRISGSSQDKSATASTYDEGYKAPSVQMSFEDTDKRYLEAEKGGNTEPLTNPSDLSQRWSAGILLSTISSPQPPGQRLPIKIQQPDGHQG